MPALWYICTPMEMIVKKYRKCSYSISLQDLPYMHMFIFHFSLQFILITGRFSAFNTLHYSCVTWVSWHPRRGFPHKRSIMRKALPCHDVIISYCQTLSAFMTHHLPYLSLMILLYDKRAVVRPLSIFRLSALVCGGKAGTSGARVINTDRKDLGTFYLPSESVASMAYELKIVQET